MDSNRCSAQESPRAPGLAGALGFLGLAGLLALPVTVWAGETEVSAGFSYGRNDYGNGNYEWSRHWSASLGYYLWETEEIELGFQDSVDRTMIAGYEDTTFHDQVFSVDWVQAFAGRRSLLQPYVKIGIGQLNRQASGFDFIMGQSPPAIYDQVTGIAGAGLKIRFSRAMGLKVEATSYLTSPGISTWQQNLSGTAGLSFYY